MVKKLNLPPQAFPKHRHYAADRFNFFTIAYNTNLVKPNEVPNSYEDLLHPRWVGRIGIEAGDTDWFGSIVKLMGEDKGLAFFRKLSQMKPQIRTGHTLMAELVASGEIPLAATIYNHNAERLLVNGAPVKWKALTPTFGRPNAVAVAKHAPRPHAALLRSEEHTSELQSLAYLVCRLLLEKKKKKKMNSKIANTQHTHAMNVY